MEQPTRWSLTDLLPEPIDASLEQASEKLEQRLAEFESMRDLLAPEISVHDFLIVLEAYKDIDILTSRLGFYAELFFAEDTQNPTALSLRDRVDQILTNASNRVLFFDLWFKELPEETAAELIQHSGDLHYFLESMRRFQPHTLSEAEERIINIKDVNGIDALIHLYEMITGHFTFTLEVYGQKKTLTGDQLGTFFQDPSPELRATAYQEFYRVYAENAAVLAQIFIHCARDWYSEGIELRGYESPIAARNLGNDLPDSVVDTLLSVCRQNAGLFQRYFELKARLLGLDKLRRYDIYAPLAASVKKYDYAYSKQIILDSFRLFSPQVAELAQRVFDENHLDSEPRPGKRRGAFCFSALPKLTPWVFVHYDGRADDITTLAHELGHAVHAMLSHQHPTLTFRASLPLAETASIFAEMQLTEHLLKEEVDPSVRRDLLARALDDTYVKVIRQAYFTIFEKDAHAMIVEGNTLEELGAKYLVNLREQFGDAVDVPDEFKWEWICIPHFYDSPFYTYAYSFGQLLVLSLYQQYRLEGERFIPRYLKILSYGGSESPAKILAEAGLDITSPAFWQGGFEVIKNMIAQLETLC
jgi:oligoendopeptidase F